MTDAARTVLCACSILAAYYIMACVLILAGPDVATVGGLP